jgi:hypothetical protein
MSRIAYHEIHEPNERNTTSHDSRLLKNLIVIAAKARIHLAEEQIPLDSPMLGKDATHIIHSIE